MAEYSAKLGLQDVSIDSAWASVTNDIGAAFKAATQHVSEGCDNGAGCTQADHRTSPNEARGDQHKVL